MKAIFPSVFPKITIDCHMVRTVVHDGRYVIIFLLDGTHLKSEPQDIPYSDMEELTSTIKRQLDRCRASPQPQFEV